MNKIFFDGTKLSADVAGGVVNYIIQLCNYYKRYGTTHNIQIEIVLFKKLPENTSLKESESKAIYESSLMMTYFQFMKSMLFGLSEEYIIFHSPYMFLPPKKKNRINILTVLDLINLEKPFTIRNYLRKSALLLGIKRADFYICISEATKAKLQTHFPEIKDNQIAVTYLGVDQTFMQTATSLQFQELTQDPYLLYVGQRKEYKNFIALIKFMASSAKNKKLKVLCVGGGKFTPEEIELLHQYNLMKTIIHVGYSSTEDLKFLYQHAVALAYTSLAEGFGLPILEAMASRCPVICGNFSSMKEIAGGHAVLVDDFSVQSLEKAIELVGSLSASDIENARTYASDFTWEKTALNTLSLYNQLASSIRK